MKYIVENNCLREVGNNRIKYVINDITRTMCVGMVVGINAIQLRGRDITEGVPDNGQVLQWNEANNEWEYVDIGAAILPPGTDAQILVYDGVASDWKNRTMSGDISIDRTGITELVAGDAGNLDSGNLNIDRMPLGGTWTFTSTLLFNPSPGNIGMGSATFSESIFQIIGGSVISMGDNEPTVQNQRLIVDVDTGEVIIEQGATEQFKVDWLDNVTGSVILDEDNMISNSVTKLATQQSIKAYVDNSVITDHGGLTSIGVNTHAEIDSHIASSSNPHSVTALQVSISDAGEYYTSANVEGALQEIGSGSVLDNRYVNVTGDTMTGVLELQNDLLFTFAGADYLLTDRSDSFVVKSVDSGVPSVLEIFSNDGDGTDQVGVKIYAEGTVDNITNRSRLNINYVTGANLYQIISEADGTGTLRPISIYTEGNDNQLYLGTNGFIGVAHNNPLTDVHIKKVGPIFWVEDDSAGNSVITTDMSGIQLSAKGMNTSSKYTPGIKFMSTDSDFTTQNPKLLGLIIGRATEVYSADTSGGMALDFFVTPNTPGASSIPVRAMYIDQDGKIFIDEDTGDPTLVFNLTGQNWSIGVDNLDSDKFKIALGSDLSTSTVEIDNSGNFSLVQSGADLSLTNTSQILVDDSVGTARTVATINSSDQVIFGASTLPVGGETVLRGATDRELIFEQGADNEVAKFDVSHDFNVLQGSVILDNDEAYKAKDSGDTIWNIGKINTSDVVVIGNSSLVLSLVTGSGDEMTFLQGSSEMARFTSSGYLVIGDTVASALFEAVDDATNTIEFQATQYGVFGAGFTGRKAGGTKASPSAVPDGNTIFAFGVRGYNGTGFTTSNNAVIRFRADGLWSGSNNGVKMDFGVTPNGSTSRLNELLYLDGTECVINNSGVEYSFRVETDNEEYMIYAKGDVDRLGVRTSAPIATVDIAGSQADSVTIVDTSTYTILTTDRVITVEYTDTGAPTLTLPSASDCWNSTDGTGTVFVIKDKGANAATNNITINRAGSDTIIESSTGQTSVSINTDGGTKIFQAVNATTWIVY